MINNCKNNFWKAEISFDSFLSDVVVTVDQRYFVPKRYTTFEKIYIDNILSLIETDIILELEKAMREVIKNMECCGYRVMEVRNEE